MKKVKWGVIGAGGIADRRTLPGMMLAENAELIAVMEISAESAEKLRAKYNAKRTYTDYKELLADTEVEAVYIASPVMCHKEQAISAAEAGKHIMCEKPIAMNLADCAEVVEACVKNKVLAATGFMMRYHGYHQKIKQMIESGAIGQVVSARGQLTCWYPEIDGAWRQVKALSGGGALIDMGIHCIDLIEYITGGKTVKTVAFNDTKTFKYDVEDSSSVLIKLDNGVTGYVDSNFNIPDEAAFCRLEFYGTKGSILAEGTINQVETGTVKAVLTGDAGVYDVAQNRDINGAVTIEADLGNMYTKEIESFSNSIINQTPVEVPITDAVHIQKVVEAAYEASNKGITINIYKE